MNRLACALLAILAFAAAPAMAQKKVLRVAYLIAETNFDPAATADLYSNSVIEEIFDSALTYDYLARPAKLKPQTLEAMPEITDQGRTYTLKVRKGIYYSDDAAFEGRKRELVARDYEYAMKRLVDPKVKSPNLWLIENRIAGMEAFLSRVNKEGKLDYDAKLPGVEVVDRYTLRIRLAKTDYNFLYILAMPTIVAQAREVVERYGDDIGAHPVGTGGFRLAEWRRSSRIVLEKNPNFREEYYEAEPPADDPLMQQLYSEVRGKRLPMVDRVEVAIIEESQPRWLAFLNSELDWINLPYEFLNMAIPGGKPSPTLARRGVRHIPDIEIATVYLYFNMKDPIVGGYSPDKVALRRAFSLAYNTQEEAELVRNGTAIEAQSLLPPGVLGYDPDFNLGKTFDIPKAKALLDMFGYTAREKDGFRSMPDGSPLVFSYVSEPDQLSRQFQQLWQKAMDAINVRMTVDIAKWPDHRKMSKAEKLPMWQLAWGADYPDGENFYQLLYGPNCGSSNDGCFNLKEFDALYDKAALIPPGPERTALYQQMARLVAAYVPIKPLTHRKYNFMLQPWVRGWRKHPILHEGYKFVDVDLARRSKELP